MRHPPLPRVRLAVALVTATVLACGEGGVSPTAPEMSHEASRALATGGPARVALAPAGSGDTLVMGGVGTTLQLTGTALDAAGAPVTGVTLVFRAGDTAVVKVDSLTGLVRQTGLGTRKVRLLVRGRATPTDSVFIVGATAASLARSLVLTPAGSGDTLDLPYVGQRVRLGGTAYDARGAALPAATVVFVPQQNAVITLDSAGVLVAGANGLAKVLGTVSGNRAIRDSVYVRVRPVVARIAITPATATLAAVGEHVRLRAAALDSAGAAIATVVPVLKSTNADVLALNASNVARATGLGVVAHVRSLVAGVTGVASIALPFAGEMEIATPTRSVVAGQSITLSTRGRQDGKVVRLARQGRAIRWHSSDAGIATVTVGDSLSTFQARRPGTVTVSAERFVLPGDTLLGDADAELLVTVRPIPAPQGTTAAPTGPDAIRVTWTNVASPAAAMVLYRTARGVTDSVALPATATSYTYTGLPANTAYTFRVRGCIPTSCGNPSPPATAATVPSAPADLVATATGTTAALHWRNTTTLATSLKVVRTTGAGRVEIGLPTPADGSYGDAVLAANTTYTYRVAACNAAGCAESAASITSTVPAPPPASAAVLSGGTQIDVAWAPSNAVAAYEVQRQVNDGAFGALVSASQTASRDGTLTSNTLYGYQVRACNAAGCSDYGTVAREGTTPAAPSTPLVLRGQANDGALILAWVDNSRTETAFEVYGCGASPSRGCVPGTLMATVGANSIGTVLTGLSNEVLYAFRVRAVRVSGGVRLVSAFSGTSAVINP